MKPRRPGAGGKGKGTPERGARGGGRDGARGGARGERTGGGRGFAPRGERSERGGGGFAPRGERAERGGGGFAPRGRPARDGAGFAPRGGRPERDGGGFAPRGRPARDGAGFAPRGGRPERDGGGFGARGGRPARGGGFGARDDRGGGFAPRGERAEREGGLGRRSERGAPDSGEYAESARAESHERKGGGDTTGRFIYGVNPVVEALRARPERIEKLYVFDGALGPRVAGEIFSRSRDAGVRVERIDRDRLAQLADGGVHQGVVAEVRQFEYLELPQLIQRAKDTGRPGLVVVLDGIQDPHNFGAIVRSAHAFGAHGVVVQKDRAAGVTGTVAKASAGAIEHCDVARVVNLSRALDQLKEAGFWTVAADPEGDRDAFKADLTGPLVVVVGAEGGGVRELVLKHCDFRVRIPMSGQVASLNASVSAGVLLYEIARQRAGVRAAAPAAS